jgi:cytochrome c2
VNSGALSGKGGKWNDKTLDKWLKSPADYAPGKYSRMEIEVYRNE